MGWKETMSSVTGIYYFDPYDSEKDFYEKYMLDMNDTCSVLIIKVYGNKKGFLKHMLKKCDNIEEILVCIELKNYNSRVFEEIGISKSGFFSEKQVKSALNSYPKAQ